MKKDEVYYMIHSDGRLRAILEGNQVEKAQKHLDYLIELHMTGFKTTRQEATERIGLTIVTEEEYRKISEKN
ncbi:MAG: hypothetical protein IJ995_03960 [Clostridia bacterium]|nr:hypothetical protein [Clostridia bacterium]